jgi:hypothetical protein
MALMFLMLILGTLAPVCVAAAHAEPTARSSPSITAVEGYVTTAD